MPRIPITGFQPTTVTIASVPSSVTLLLHQPSPQVTFAVPAGAWTSGEWANTNTGPNDGNPFSVYVATKPRLALATFPGHAAAQTTPVTALQLLDIIDAGGSGMDLICLVGDTEVVGTTLTALTLTLTRGDMIETRAYVDYEALPSPMCHAMQRFVTVTFTDGYYPGINLDTLLGSLGATFVSVRPRDAHRLGSFVSGVLVVTDQDGAELANGAACSPVDLWQYRYD